MRLSRSTKRVSPTVCLPLNSLMPLTMRRSVSTTFRKSCWRQEKILPWSLIQVVERLCAVEQPIIGWSPVYPEAISRSSQTQARSTLPLDSKIWPVKNADRVSFKETEATSCLCLGRVLEPREAGVTHWIHDNARCCAYVYVSISRYIFRYFFLSEKL